MGPVVIIDTPGFDDEGALGELRVKKTREILNRADCAVAGGRFSQGRRRPMKSCSPCLRKRDSFSDCL